MNILDKLNITKEMADHEKLKIVGLLGNEKLNEQISKYSALQFEVATLAEQLKNEDDNVEDLQKTLNEKKEVVNRITEFQ